MWNTTPNFHSNTWRIFEEWWGPFPSPQASEKASRFFGNSKANRSTKSNPVKLLLRRDYIYIIIYNNIYIYICIWFICILCDIPISVPHTTIHIGCISISMRQGRTCHLSPASLLTLMCLGQHSGCWKQPLKMAIEIVDFPMNSMVIFHSFLYVYQRVKGRLFFFPFWAFFLLICFPCFFAFLLFFLFLLLCFSASLLLCCSASLLFSAFCFSSLNNTQDAYI